MSVKEYRGK